MNNRVVEAGELYENEFKAVSVSMSDLHTDIIYNILGRLQVKFICRCKLVCREWYNLVSGPYFIHYYEKNTAFTTLVLSHYNKRSVDPSIPRRNTFSFFEISKDNILDSTLTTFEPKLPFLPPPSVSMIGTCNGLLCLRLRNNYRPDCEVIYTYNPNSGESISLPKHTFDPYELSYVVVLVYLFCFSPSSNNFKVVKIVFLKSDGRPHHVHRCEIFTVGVDHEWRRLQDPFEPGYPCCRLGVNGAVCWLPYDNDDSTNIPCFDFGQEKVAHVSCPSNVVLNYRNMNLVVLNHRLCLVDYSNPCHYTIWTMEEYGIADSWTKSHVILRSCFPPLVLHYPIAKLRNGNLLFRLARGKGLVCYSPKQKECSIVEVSDDVEWCITYSQEFASLGSLQLNREAII